VHYKRFVKIGLYLQGKDQAYRMMQCTNRSQICHVSLQNLFLCSPPLGAHITPHLSVCLSVPCQLLTQKQY